MPARDVAWHGPDAGESSGIWIVTRLTDDEGFLTILKVGVIDYFFLTASCFMSMNWRCVDIVIQFCNSRLVSCVLFLPARFNEC